MLARFGAGGSFDSITRHDVSKMAQDWQLLLESHHSYPALGYFRWQESYYALARITFLLIETVTLIKSVLSQG
jgi:hypothetical protein